MKKIFMLLIGIISFVGTESYAQCVADDCNPFISGMGYTVTCKPVGGTTVLNVGWGIGSTDGACTAPAGSWKIVIQFPQTGVYGITGTSAVSGGTEFNWDYNATTKLLVGTSNQPLGMNIFANPPYANGGTVSITVNGLTSNNCTGVTTSAQIQLTIPPFPGNCLAAFANQTGDDYATSTFGVETPTPLKFLGFSASEKNCEYFDLNWSTQSEVNNHYFSIERKLGDGNFIEIGKVFSDKNVMEVNHYTFRDIDLVPETDIYYRIKQIDLDGNFLYSRVISVRSKCLLNKLIRFFPNPATNLIQIGFGDFKLNDEELTIELLDQSGKKILNRLVQRDRDLNQIQLYLPHDIAGGNYICNVKRGDILLATENVVVIR